MLIYMSIGLIWASYIFYSDYASFNPKSINDWITNISVIFGFMILWPFILLGLAMNFVYRNNINNGEDE